jgi:hypothetical protein
VDHQLQQLFYFGLKSEGFFSSNSHFWHPIKICTFGYLGMILPISRALDKIHSSLPYRFNRLLLML